MPSKARPNSIKSCRDNYSVLFLKEDVLQAQIHYTQKFASCSSRSTRSLRVNTAAFFGTFIDLSRRQQSSLPNSLRNLPFVKA